MKALFVLVTLVIASTTSFARDSSHLVCTGYMEAKPGPDNYGMAIHFDESRASDGTKRLEVLSAIWGGDLYQGSRLNENDGFGQNGQIVMSLKNDPSQVYYQGAYNIVADAKTGTSKLVLKGQLNIELSSDPADYQNISTVLSCVNISN